MLSSVALISTQPGRQVPTRTSDNRVRLVRPAARHQRGGCLANTRRERCRGCALRRGKPEASRGAGPSRHSWARHPRHCRRTEGTPIDQTTLVRRSRRTNGGVRCRRTSCSHGFAGRFTPLSHPSGRSPSAVILAQQSARPHARVGSVVPVVPSSLREAVPSSLLRLYSPSFIEPGPGQGHAQSRAPLALLLRRCVARRRACRGRCRRRSRCRTYPSEVPLCVWRCVCPVSYTHLTLPTILLV